MTIYETFGIVGLIVAAVQQLALPLAGVVVCTAHLLKE